MARAIFACPLPVISAVGHETDFTISDFVADLRAPTPSAAAEVAVPSRLELRGQLQDYYSRLGYGLGGKVRFTRKRLAALARARIFRHKEELVAQRQLELDELGRRLEETMGKTIGEKNHGLRLLARGLEQLSPLATLSRGYSICLREDEVIGDAAKLAVGEDLELIFAKGKANCTVRSIKSIDSGKILD